MLPPGSPHSRNIKDAVLGDLKHAAIDALRSITGDYTYYLQPIGFGAYSMISGLEVGGRIIREINKRNQYYSESYPYQYAVYNKTQNNNKNFIPKSSSENIRYSEFDLDENTLGK